MRSFPPNYLVPSPNTMSRNSEPFRSSRPPSRASVAATFLVFLLTLSAGTPGFAQSDPPLTVTDVYVSSRPFSGGDTFGPSDRVLAAVVFSEPVVVTGEPSLVLQIGNQARSADLVGVFGAGATFTYYVTASDRDDDGISIPANAVQLNGGSIRDSGGNDADLAHEAVPDDPQLKVDGRLDAIPTITGVSLGSPRDRGDTFGLGAALLVRVQFSELVDVTGTPQLTIQVGTQARQADLHRRLGTSLIFEYIVQSSDVDADGLSVPADALSLNGGSIRDADGNDADLTHAALAADPQRKVNGASGVPTVARMRYLESPASQATYVAGERIFVFVEFSRGVHVTGAPQLTIQVGAQARRADHLPRLRAAQLLLPQGNGFHLPAEQDLFVYFEYVVQPSDVDDDGISVPANALTLNGGSIRAVDDNSDASLSHNGLADDPRRKVDGTRGDDQAPTVASLWVEQPVHGTFGGGDAIVTSIWFSEGMTMTGAPRLALRIGAETRFATFRERNGSTSLVFEYVVAESDRDDDGISIAADAFDLNGGTIQDNAGNDASVDLGYHAFNDDPNFKVNGRLTPVPALPLGGVLALLFALLGGGWRRLARQPERRR